jgi:signal transduction histidine kinase
VTSTATAEGPGAARPGSQRVLDVALAVVVFGATLALLAHGGLRPGPEAEGGLDGLAVVLVGGSALPLVAARQRPLGMFVVTATAGVLLAGLGYPYDVSLGAAAALYLLAASRSPDTMWTGRMTVVVLGLFAAYLAAAAIGGGAFPVSELLHNGMAWAVAWFAGERTRLRRAEIAELRERAVRAERDAEREALLAAAEERARIARDLHDDAGTAVSVIAVRAGAARLRHHQDPDRSLAALEAIEQLARQIGDEIDQIVGTLRNPGSTTAVVEAPVGLASLDSLVAQHRSTGLDVTVEVAGRSRHVGGAVDQAVYRILQESLANAARHGEGRAHVDLVVDDTGVALTVTNPVAHPVAPRRTGGHGLIGMRERATLLGGDLQVDRVNGTFRLQAQIPHPGRM